MAQSGSQHKQPSPRQKPGAPGVSSRDVQSPENFLNRALRFLTRFQRFFFDLAGIGLIALGSMTILAFLFPTLAGGLLNWWAGVLMTWFGWGGIVVALAMGGLGLWILRARSTGALSGIPWRKVVMLEIAFFSSLALLAVFAGGSIMRAEAGLGGRIGWALAEVLGTLLTPFRLGAPFWRGLLLLTIFLFALMYGTNLIKLVSRWSSRRKEAELTPGIQEILDNSAVVEAPLDGVQIPPSSKGSGLSLRRQKRVTLEPEYRKSFRVRQEHDTRTAAPLPRNELLPPLDLLFNEKAVRPDERNINQTAGLIEKTLAEFGIPAKVVDFQIGPTVTQFAVEPGFVEKEKTGSEGDLNRQKVRVAQISSLRRDLALALSAERLRIQAPVPGRPYVGIEVPNLQATVVRLRPILESEAFYKVGSPLTIALGRDVSGQPVVADLASMPHLLVAGTTGSGKSVCIAAITTCLVMNNSPEELRLVMMDPKMVELVRFNGLPHLFGKVETELERVLAVLRWTVAEMDRRYKLLESSRSRNIDTYNRKARRRSDMDSMPRIVVLLDELADLMMSAPDQTEHNLVRLAQMARATGIHLVVATQRPSTDVVTGLIKANFPARISFAVASSVDSRVILDTVGAEALLGHGDMLFLPPEVSAPIRSQGVMVSDQEVERVITYWQKTHSIPGKTETVPWDVMLAEEEVLADKDDLIEKAIQVVRETQRASASLLQRRLRIGYPRAARLIDELEELGVIGSAQRGGRDREVLLGENEEPGLD